MKNQAPAPSDDEPEDAHAPGAERTLADLERLGVYIRQLMDGKIRVQQLAKELNVEELATITGLMAKYMDSRGLYDMDRLQKLPPPGANPEARKAAMCAALVEMMDADGLSVDEGIEVELNSGTVEKASSGSALNRSDKTFQQWNGYRQIDGLNDQLPFTYQINKQIIHRNISSIKEFAKIVGGGITESDLTRLMMSQPQGGLTPAYASPALAERLADAFLLTDEKRGKFITAATAHARIAESEHNKLGYQPECITLKSGEPLPPIDASKVNLFRISKLSKARDEFYEMLSVAHGARVTPLEAFDFLGGKAGTLVMGLRTPRQFDGYSRSLVSILKDSGFAFDRKYEPELVRLEQAMFEAAKYPLDIRNDWVLATEMKLDYPGITRERVLKHALMLRDEAIKGRTATLMLENTKLAAGDAVKQAEAYVDAHYSGIRRYPIRLHGAPTLYLSPKAQSDLVETLEEIRLALAPPDWKSTPNLCDHYRVSNSTVDAYREELLPGLLETHDEQTVAKQWCAAYDCMSNGNMMMYHSPLFERRVVHDLSLLPSDLPLEKAPKDWSGETTTPEIAAGSNYLRRERLLRMRERLIVLLEDEYAKTYSPKVAHRVAADVVDEHFVSYKQGANTNHIHLNVSPAMRAMLATQNTFNHAEEGWMTAQDVVQCGGIAPRNMQGDIIKGGKRICGRGTIVERMRELHEKLNELLFEHYVEKMPPQRAEFMARECTRMFYVTLHMSDTSPVKNGFYVTSAGLELLGMMEGGHLNNSVFEKRSDLINPKHMPEEWAKRMRSFLPPESEWKSPAPHAGKRWNSFEELCYSRKELPPPLMERLVTRTTEKMEEQLVRILSRYERYYGHREPLREMVARAITHSVVRGAVLRMERKLPLGELSLQVSEKMVEALQAIPIAHLRKQSGVEAVDATATALAAHLMKTLKLERDAGQLLMAEARCGQISFGELLRGLRATKKQRQEDVAKIVGVATTNYKEWEHDNQKPGTADSLDKLVKWSGMADADAVDFREMACGTYGLTPRRLLAHARVGEISWQNVVEGLRRRKDISQEETAKQIGCSLDSYKKWQRGAFNPDDDSVEKIVKWAGYTGKDAEDFSALCRGCYQVTELTLLDDACQGTISVGQLVRGICHIRRKPINQTAAELGMDRESTFRRCTNPETEAIYTPETYHGATERDVLIRLADWAGYQGKHRDDFMALCKGTFGMTPQTILKAHQRGEIDTPKKWLEALRYLKDQNSQETATELGVHRNSYRNWENGDTDIQNPMQLMKLAAWAGYEGQDKETFMRFISPRYKARQEKAGDHADDESIKPKGGGRGWKGRVDGAHGSDEDDGTPGGHSGDAKPRPKRASRGNAAVDVMPR